MPYRINILVKTENHSKTIFCAIFQKIILPDIDFAGYYHFKSDSTLNLKIEKIKKRPKREKT
ncbi:hypothetical protein BpHYR1_025086 [Brachionus plicatilis]|uniref:Uncharacterized protein n=1 Tax=Brachionus plicatilis TaxID=10195 RepID=A0A3M7RGP1_BRAPC|nr:hypothetical protein BpHYR1_025086 [Brachionus plicatilis]